MAHWQHIVVESGINKKGSTCFQIIKHFANMRIQGSVKLGRLSLCLIENKNST